MKVIVCGGREYDDEQRAFSVLDERHAEVPFTLVIQGNARGADTLGRMWAEARCIPCLCVPANWDRDGRAAGPIRNRKMLDCKPHLVIAFPGGRGTANMVKQAKDADVPVLQIEK